MSNFGYALSQGLAAGAGAGVGMINQQLSEEADARAADRRLDTEARLMAVQESFTQRAEARREAMRRDGRGADATQDIGINRDKTLAGIELNSTPEVTGFKSAEAVRAAENQAAASRVTKDSDLAWSKDNLAEEARQKRVLAQAGHIVSPSEAINVEMSKLKLDDQKRIRDLQAEYENAPPDMQAKIVEKIQLISGKDNDSYSTVPIKDETGSITGYQVFDKKRGTLKNANAGGDGLDEKLAARIKEIVAAKSVKAVAPVASAIAQPTQQGMIPTVAAPAPLERNNRGQLSVPERVSPRSQAYKWNGTVYPDEATANAARKAAM